MRILGIDPSTTATGFGLIELIDFKPHPISYGVIRLSSKDHLHQRLKIIYDRLGELIVQYQPAVVALEDVFYSRNIKVALHLGHARGAVILAATNHQIPVREYSPLSVKQAVTGQGGASKEQVQRMIQRLLNLSEMPTPLDASDALAVALCDLLKTQTHVRF